MPTLHTPEVVHEIVIAQKCEADHQNIAWQHLADMSDEELDADLKLDDFFGSIYVVNLPQAKERLQRITEDMAKIGLKHFTLWRATNGRDPEEMPEAIWRKMSHNWRNLDLSKPEDVAALHHQYKGEAGCFMSHYRLIKTVQSEFHGAVEELRQALQQKDLKRIAKARRMVKKSSTILVMEDDNNFGFVNADYRTARQEGIGRLLREAMTELPNDWDMIYFMAQSYQPALEFTPHLKQLTFGSLTNAYAISYRMYDAMVQQLQRIEDPLVTSLMPVDNEMAQLHSSHRCYAVTPSLAYQCDGATFIVGWVYDWLRQIQP